MKHRYFVLPIVTTTILVLIGIVFFHWLNQPIKGNDFTKMTIYMNWDNEGPFVITDKDVIESCIKKINSSPKKDITKIAFEQGPDGRIIFEGKKTVEVKVFSYGGNVVTDKHLINTGFNLENIITKE
ncbi:hypothetical protein E3U55_04535 [Filobacillus milosensis]|uniref:Uncharacterized protein n=1 Tax=Filobacillus milosensis TaxID=94137 RepID=A0A4Y8IXH5_9BACI|nr:hypothetical protein [Filobacillus milosensis]TFB24085.1 hypothetical protein E3U55_04535 [Filobacillus milosensis]